MSDRTVVYSPKAAMETMVTMGTLAHNALQDPYVIEIANRIIAGVRPRDYDGQIHALRRFMESNFYFVDNPLGLQRVQPPRVMLDTIDARDTVQGACNDAATLIATLGLADGLPARFVAYAFGKATGDPSIDNQVPFTHVAADLYDGRDWVTLDVTRPYEMWAMPDVVRTETLDLY